MPSAASTVASPASGLLYFLFAQRQRACQDTLLSQPLGANPHRTDSLLLGTLFFFWGRLQLLSKWTGWRLHNKKQSVPKQKKRTRQTRGHQQRNTNRERHAHEFCGFCVLHRLSAASVCGEKEEASLVWNITPPHPYTIFPFTIFESPMICRWHGRKRHFLLPPDECKVTFDEPDTHNSSSHGIKLEFSLVGKETHVTVRRGGRD